jgi:hypothetical protein
MKFFPQQTETDCLLACVECLTETPREELTGIEYYPGGYLSYSSMYSILESKNINWGFLMSNKQKTLHDFYVESDPMIIGIVNKFCFHAVFYSGSVIWCPKVGVLNLKVHEMRVAYAIIPESSTKRNKTLFDKKCFLDVDAHCRKTMNSGEISNALTEDVMLNYPCLNVIP